MVVGSLTNFDPVCVLTGGGPGYATRILPLDMYITGFQSNEMGLASAISVVLVVAGLVVSESGPWRASAGRRCQCVGCRGIDQSGAHNFTHVTCT